MKFDGNYIDISYDFNGTSETHMTHGKEGVSIEGTLYFASKSVDVIHAYSVYQSKDGRVYLVRIAGRGVNGEVSERIGFSQTYKDEHMLTINENQSNHSQVGDGVEVIVNIGIKYIPQKVKFIQINTEHVQISREEYEAQDLPEEVSIGPNTAYLVVESNVNTPDGEVVRREIFDREDEQFIGYVLRDGWLCAPKYVEFVQ